MSDVQRTRHSQGEPSARTGGSEAVNDAAARRVLDEAMRLNPSNRKADDYVRANVTAEVLAHATPEEKSHLLRCLMVGHTDRKDEQAMLRILQSARTASELKTVLGRTGGGRAVLAELGSQERELVAWTRTRGEEGARMLLAFATSLPPKDPKADDFVTKYVDESVLVAADPSDKEHMIRSLVEGRTTKTEAVLIQRILTSERDPAGIKDLMTRCGTAHVLDKLGDATDGLVNHLRATGEPGDRAILALAVDGSDPAHPAEGFIAKYVDAPALSHASAEDKTRLIRALLHHGTGKTEEAAVLRILDSTRTIEETTAVINGVGKGWLAKDIDDSKLLRSLESKIFQVTKSEAPEYRPLSAGTDPATADARLAELDRYLEVKGRAFHDLTTGIRQSARFDRFYNDLSRIAKEDRAQLRNVDKLSTQEKIALYNQIAHEVSVEFKHNVNLTKGNKNWSHDEIQDLDRGLQALPPHLSLENEKLFNVRRFDRIVSGGSDIFAWAKANGDIEFTDRGVNAQYRLTGRGVRPVTEVLVHEVGHHFDDESETWKRFKSLSSWVDAGTARDRRLAQYSNGDTVLGRDLGLADETGRYVVSRQYGRTWAHREDAQFGIGQYTRANPYDDFAETFMQYFLAGEDLRKLAPDKYRYMDQLGRQNP